MAKAIIINTDAEAAYQAAQDKSEIDRAEREAKYKVDHTRPNWKPYKTKSEMKREGI